MDNPYDGDVVLNTNSGIVSLLTTNSYGFSYLFTATSDTLVHKVINCVWMMTLVCNVQYSMSGKSIPENYE